MTPRCPDGLPFRLLLLVIEIELKLRLPANLGGYHQVNYVHLTVLTMLNLISLTIILVFQMVFQPFGFACR